MKTVKYLLIILLIGGFTLYMGCKDDDKPEPTFTLSSLMADGIDLAGVTSAADVPEEAVIEAVFSSEIDPTTASSSTIIITETDGGAAASYTVSASGTKATITPSDKWAGGTQFTIQLTSNIMGTNGVAYGGNSLTFRTSGIFVPKKENQVLFISFDNSTAEDEVGDHTVTTVETLGFVEDRRATANSAAYFDGEGNLVEIAANADLISPSITISYWIKTDLADYDGGDGTGVPQTRFVMGLGAELGYFLEMGRRSKDPLSPGFNEIFLKYATDHVNVGANSAAVPKATAWTEINSQINVNFSEEQEQNGFSFAIDQLKNTNDPLNRDYVREQVMGEWTHLALTIDASARTKTIYVNGVKYATFQWISTNTKDWTFADLSLKTMQNDGVTPIDGVNGILALGNACSSTNTSTGWCNYETLKSNPAETKKLFKGAMDQFRIFNVALTDEDIQTLYDNEK
jgi:hypothetical protein